MQYNLGAGDIREKTGRTWGRILILYQNLPRARSGAQLSRKRPPQPLPSRQPHSTPPWSSKNTLTHAAPRGGCHFRVRRGVGGAMLDCSISQIGDRERHLLFPRWLRRNVLAYARGAPPLGEGQCCRILESWVGSPPPRPPSQILYKR